MKVVYILFSIAGWGWLGVVAAYMGWRLYRERTELNRKHEEQR